MMSEQKRLIGDRYDHEKFDNGFRRAAYAMAAESFVSPDSPAGKTLQTMFYETMKMHIAGIPTEYYQVLEIFAEGGSIEDLAAGAPVEAWKGAGDEKFAKLMMEIVTGRGESELQLRDPEAAERYYDERFPERVTECAETKETYRRKLTFSEKLSTGGRPSEKTTVFSTQKEKEHSELEID